MAELFSLMLESTSCKGIRVEAIRIFARRSLPAFLPENAFATAEISRDSHGAKPCACHTTDSHYALEMTYGDRLVSFRARAGDAYRVVRATSSAADREESRPRHLHTLSMRRATPSSSMEADGRSAIGESRRRPRQTGRKSRYQKDVGNRPIRRNHQHLQRVYFLSQ
jgi:hypothetical protein